jgi:DNA polymerase-1
MRGDLLVLDGRHLLWRTSDAFKDLSATVDGEEMSTGGMYGFLTCAIRIHSKFGGRAVVAWEGKNNFRFDLFPGYKGRGGEPDQDRLNIIAEMDAQEQHLIKMLSLIGVEQYRGVACEADDVIGRLAREGAARGETVIVYSGDSDLRQLVRPSVFVVAPGFRSDTLYDAQAVEKKHGVPPRLIAQLKALAGDHSDKIPGAPGIGAVTAAKLLNHYGSLRRVLLASFRPEGTWPETPRRRKLISDSWADVLLYYKLTRIRTNLDWELIPAQPGSPGDLTEALLRYKFASLVHPSEKKALWDMAKCP